MILNGKKSGNGCRVHRTTGVATSSNPLRHFRRYPNDRRDLRDYISCVLCHVKTVLLIILRTCPLRTYNPTAHGCLQNGTKVRVWTVWL